MSFIVWNDRLHVDVVTVDGEHRELIGILNELYDAIAQNAAGNIVRDTLDRLLRYTEYHFLHEEELFLRTAYPDAEPHRLEHVNMTAWVKECLRRYDEGETAGLPLEMVNFLKDWLFDHILGSDQQYAEYMREAGIS